MEENRLKDFGLSYVGRLTAIMTLSNKEVAMASMESHSESFSTLFSNFRLWNGEDIPFNRIATLNIFGGLFGEIIQPSTFSWQVEDNSMGSVKILTSQKSRIDEAVVISWNNKSFVAWASETPGLWSPNFDIDKSSESAGSESDEETEDMGDETEEGKFRPNMVGVENYGQPKNQRSRKITIQVPKVKVHLKPGADCVGDARSTEDTGTPADKGTRVDQDSSNINEFMEMHEVHGGEEKMTHYSNNHTTEVVHVYISNKEDGHVPNKTNSTNSLGQYV
ncbi:hypothetical protein Hanom_Chr00s000017g01616671 [Helianthus anomalus]